MGRIIEGFWDCKYCNSTGIRGGLRECPNCGKARDENTTFYLDKKKISYVPKEKAATINRNPDWICQYCNQLNSDNDKTCVSCGAVRTDQNLNYFQNRSKKNDEEIKKSLQNEQSDSELNSNFSSFSKSTFSEKTHFSLKNFFLSNLTNILIALVVSLGVIGLIYLLIPKTQKITITEMSQQRSIEIEKYQTVEESDWSLPTGARLQYSREEFSHYQQVLDHYETKTRQVTKERISGYENYVSGYRDLGNGYFEEITSSRPIYETYYETETYQDPVYRNEAVYQTKYYYEIDKWLYERSIKTNGVDKKPYWGDVTLESNERESSKSEFYYVTGLNKKNKESKISLSFSDWSSLEVGQSVKLKISLGYGKIVE